MNAKLQGYVSLWGNSIVRIASIVDIRARRVGEDVGLSRREATQVAMTFFQESLSVHSLCYTQNL